MKKALLIGINYTSTPDVQLNGCIDDVVNMRNTLIDAYDYESANITLLRDDELRAAYQPTRDNIINNLKSLVAQSGNLSELWIHYSGHGSQIRDTNRDETSGYDSMIIPSDFQVKGFILDDELLSIIQTIKCKSILMFDSCNSGTVCDLPWSFEYKNTGAYVKTKNNHVVIQNPNIYMLSGCKDNQTSADAYNNDAQQYVGAFTNALITSLRMNRHNVPFLLLYRDVCNYLKSNGFSQIPIMSSTTQTPNHIFTRATQLTIGNDINKMVMMSANKSIRAKMRLVM
jgi:hypothetical protein